MKQPPLHELVLAYKMEADRLMLKRLTPMEQVCEVFNLSKHYTELLKISDTVTNNDVAVFGALSIRYIKNV